VPKAGAGSGGALRLLYMFGRPGTLAETHSFLHEQQN